jgi:YggT family protein
VDYLIFLLNLIFAAYYLLIMARVFLSWFPVSRFQKGFKYVYLLTEPLLSVIRAGLPPLKVGLDASPFIAFILLWLLQRVLMALLRS